MAGYPSTKIKYNSISQTEDCMRKTEDWETVPSSAKSTKEHLKTILITGERYKVLFESYTICNHKIVKKVAISIFLNQAAHVIITMLSQLRYHAVSVLYSSATGYAKTLYLQTNGTVSTARAAVVT